ncbi:hypothetical protein [Mycobacterium sp. NPDC050853]|uniref:phage major capsid protein n=1 Tax=Mycobacterium sp. NPDC050853 TaxID=3155160 RepID=UPI0033F8EF0A
MPIEFPPVAPTLSGDILSISRFLNNPPLVLRALRTVTDQMFIADKILTGNIPTESGSAVYEQNESIFADRAPQPVAPMSEYPVTSIGTGPALTANTVNWGNDAEISDFAISRQKYPVVNRAFRKLANSHVQQIDSVALSAVASAVTQNTSAISSWAGTGAAPLILRDLMRALANILNLKQGYMPDTVLCSLTTFANVVSDEKLAQLLPREYPGTETTPVAQGLSSTFMRRIGGFTFITSPNLPTTGVATLLDSTVLGSFVDETVPAPGYVSGPDDANRLQVKTIREDKIDGWRIRARRIVVPIVQESAAAWKITGVDA